MKAVEIAKAGGPEVLTLIDTPQPEPGFWQVRIKVAYAGVNRPDALCNVPDCTTHPKAQAGCPVWKPRAKSAQSVQA